MIDLHVHTTMSDGTVSPREVVLLASRHGLRAIAITDHDTVSALPEAQDVSASAGVEVVTGVEISAQWPNGTLHILGYFVDPHETRLHGALERMRKSRMERIPKMLSKLRDMEIIISPDEVLRAARGGVPGRPHIANLLLEKGYVKTRQEAFDYYLKKGAPAYVKKVKLTPADAIQVIAGSGGLAVVAHPHSLNSHDPAELEPVIKKLVDMGLQGIEAFSPQHTPEQTTAYLNLASRLDLVVSGGTDFHGSNKPTIELGVIPGQSPLPYSILEGLKQRKTRALNGGHR